MVGSREMHLYLNLTQGGVNKRPPAGFEFQIHLGGVPRGFRHFRGGNPHSPALDPVSTIILFENLPIDTALT